MKDGNKLSWKTRLKLCWTVLSQGEYAPEDYRTINEQNQWEICEQMRKDLQKCVQPRTVWKDRSTSSSRRYTDCDEKL
jgi:hypothetical protein